MTPPWHESQSEMLDESHERTFRIEIVHASETTAGRVAVRIALETSPSDDIDLWLPSLAPSGEVWKRFSCDDYEWHEFCRLYHLELQARKCQCERLRSLAHKRSLILTYQAGDARHNVAVAMKQHLEHLECKRRYDAGWIIGGLTWPVTEEIERCGGLWFARHKAWTMPNHETWKYIHSLLPGDF
ncbi:MAG: DUF488 family protein [Planctomycetaceae bacterium]|nr:DUF488 family protein [Planctomycetales bacterium]MCB9922282.1 DUF488 family protein [Planctomycetaceae bacterium]